VTRILIDMDGVIADWGGEYGRLLDTFGEAAAAIPRHADQRQFNLNEGRTKEEQAIIAQVMVHPGFYSRLVPIPGAKQALKQMLGYGYDVRIVTSPWASNPTCASDKLNWVIKHYGSHWAKRVVITSDKTIVHGDFLIDDKPEITGAATPAWEHVLFDQPYNRHVEGKRRLDGWFNWGRTLGLEPVFEQDRPALGVVA
jgi:5'-nucleotidase